MTTALITAASAWRRALTRRLAVGLLSASLLAVARAENEPRSFTVVSWNLQTFGTVSAARQKVCKEAYSAVVSTSVFVMAFQEVANVQGVNTFQRLIPPRVRGWAVSFEDTPDSQDNGLLFRIGGSTETASGFLFEGLAGLDTNQATHPVRWGHFRVGDFDFTLVSLHLTFRSGDANESKRELTNVLDWLQTYLKNKKNDPDVIIAGDFNLPSERGIAGSKRAGAKDWTSIESVIAEHGGFTSTKALTVLIDKPTSRSKKKPANNYDHFIVTRSVKKALIAADRFPAETIEAIDETAQVQVSDHYPIFIRLKAKGRGIKPDVQ